MIGMKTSQKSEIIATLVLIGSAVLGGFSAYASKIALKELTPTTILFLRISFMVVSLLPFVAGRLSQLRHHWKRVVFLGLLWSGNVLGFIVGIEHTTAIASSTIYTVVPLMVLFLQWIFLAIRATKHQSAGVLIGFLGALLVIFIPQADLRFGSTEGNLIMFAAITSYASYLVVSKSLSTHVSALLLTAGSALVGWVLSFFLFIVVDGFASIPVIFSATGPTWLSLIYLGVVMGGFMYWLIQWGVKYSSPLTASMMGYVLLLVASTVGVVLLGEQFTLQIILGCILIVIGVFVASVLPLFRRNV